MNSLRHRLSRKISTILCSERSESFAMKGALAPPELDIPELFASKMTKSKVPHYFVSKQGPENLNILTEEPDLPGFVTIVIYLQAGSRFENKKSAGYSHWLRSSIFDYFSKFPKVFSNSSIEYEREFFVLKSVCMSYQVEEFLGIFAEAIGPNALNRNVLKNMEDEPDQFYEPMEGFLQTCFGHTGIGNPIKGGNNYIQNQNEFAESAEALHFQLLNSQNMVIAATGIYNREAFYELVRQKFSYLQSPQSQESITLNSIRDSKPEFEGANGFASLLEACSNKKMLGDVLDSEPELVLGFEGFKSRDNDFLTGMVLEALIGEASMFSVGGPGKNTFARAHNIMAYFHKFESVICFNKYFQDTLAFYLFLIF